METKTRPQFLKKPLAYYFTVKNQMSYNDLEAQLPSVSSLQTFPELQTQDFLLSSLANLVRITQLMDTTFTKEDRSEELDHKKLWKNFNNLARSWTQLQNQEKSDKEISLYYSVESYKKQVESLVTATKIGISCGLWGLYVRKEALNKQRREIGQELMSNLGYFDSSNYQIFKRCDPKLCYILAEKIGY